MAQAGCAVSLSDTVGFIRDLPHKLVEAFEATLQEAAEADLLLHVVDAASPQLLDQLAEVERVLEEIGARDIPQILVMNKIDALEPSLQPRALIDQFERQGGITCPRVFISAAQGTGLDILRDKIAEIAVAAQLPLASDKSPEFSATLPEQGTINALPYSQP